MAKPKLSQLIEEIEKQNGNVSAIARAYNAPRSTVYRWIQASDKAMEALADQREQVVDYAESILFKRIMDGDMMAVAYTLNNSPEARARGWAIKRSEHTGADGTPLEVVIKYAED